MNNLTDNKINNEKSSIHIKKEEKKNIAEKRAELKGLSQMISKLVKEGRYFTVNEGLVELYADEGHEELHTYKQWEQKGYQVKKGETALMLWGKPKKISRENDQNREEEQDEQAEFFPICFVFSNLQVVKKGGEK